MNNLTKRNIKLLKILYDAGDYISSIRLADELDISIRTVKSEIKSINAIISLTNSFIISKYGKGYLLKLSNQFDKSLVEGKRFNHFFDSNQDRIIYILRKLLLADNYIKIEKLADDLYISRGLLTKILKDVRSQLIRFRLSIVNKPNYGILIKGNEKDKRLAISDYFFHSDIELNTEYLKDFSKIGYNKQKNRDLFKYIDEILYKYKIDLSEYSVNNLIVHLYITLSRIHSGHQIEISSELNSKNSVEYKAARELLDYFRTKINIDVTCEEIDFIAEHIKSKRILDVVLLSDSEIRKLKQCIEVMYLEINNNFGFDFTLDSELYQYLYLHIPQMVRRLQAHMTIRNTSVIDNKRRYLFATKVTHSACAVIEQYYNVRVDLNEFGYLLLYFNLAITKFEVNKIIKIGIFTGRSRPESMMYLNEVREQFPSRKYVIENIQKISEDYDLIISLYKCDTEVSCPLVIIENDDYMNKVQKIVYEIRYQNLNISKYLQDEYIYFNLEGETKADVCRNFYKLLYDRNLITDIPNSANEFIDDEIGNGIVHFQDSYRIVRKNMWFICTLKKPIYWDKQSVKILMLTKTKKENDKDLYNLCRIVSKWSNDLTLINDFLRNQSRSKLKYDINNIE
ncbi:BglG family transcription antiterminator [Solobacterium moorei]|uniref:PRD domain protein n=1 Tax=Solobacterium moorei F0204 TaxID=706433 RepID=E7MQ67_9FIRM|nr:PRD domain-containing protein [Solobacterium moorei]EFW23787.1 PRD domain protein [Solobacterium moorei F0204]